MFQLYNVVVKLMDTQWQPLFTEHHFYVAFPLKCILFKSRSLSSDVTAKWSVCKPPRFMNHDHELAKNNPSSAGLLIKHVYPEQTWIWVHVVSKWQNDDSGFVFCTKSTQKQFCHFFCTSRQAIVALFGHFFFTAVLSWHYMFTFPHLSKALGHDWSLILRNIFMNWHINWIRWQIFLTIHFNLDISNVQSQTDMMDSRETLYIISIEMFWYDSCAINIILYWPVHYKRATHSNQSIWTASLPRCYFLCVFSVLLCVRWWACDIH